MEKPTVDIIIPTYKPGKVFEELLNRLERQTYPISGILVMNTQEEFWNKDWEKRLYDLYDSGCYAGRF